MQSLLADAAGSHGAIPATAAADVAAILKESSTLVVSDDGTKVRRAEVRLFQFQTKLYRKHNFFNLIFGINLTSKIAQNLSIL